MMNMDKFIQVKNKKIKINKINNLNNLSLLDQQNNLFKTLVKLIFKIMIEIFNQILIKLLILHKNLRILQTWFLIP